jgi:hypothetical protein
VEQQSSSSTASSWVVRCPNCSLKPVFEPSGAPLCKAWGILPIHYCCLKLVDSKLLMTGPSRNLVLYAAPMFALPEHRKVSRSRRAQLSSRMSYHGAQCMQATSPVRFPLVSLTQDPLRPFSCSRTTQRLATCSAHDRVVQLLSFLCTRKLVSFHFALTAGRAVEALSLNCFSSCAGLGKRALDVAFVLVADGCVRLLLVGVYLCSCGGWGILALSLVLLLTRSI